MAVTGRQGHVCSAHLMPPAIMPAWSTPPVDCMPHPDPHCCCVAPSGCVPNSRCLQYVSAPSSNGLSGVASSNPPFSTWAVACAHMPSVASLGFCSSRSFKFSSDSCCFCCCASPTAQKAKGRGWIPLQPLLCGRSQIGDVAVAHPVSISP